MAGRRETGPLKAKPVLLCLILLLSFFACLVSIEQVKATSSNVIQNWSFETGDLTGWTLESGGVTVRSDDHNTGPHCAAATFSGSYVAFRLAQKVNLPVSVVASVTIYRRYGVAGDTFGINYTDGTTTFASLTGTTSWTQVRVTPTAGKTIDSFIVYRTSVSGTIIEFDDCSVMATGGAIFSNNGETSHENGASTIMSVKAVNVSNALTPNGGSIFSWNIGGSYVNDSWAAFSSATLNWVNTTKTVAGTVGQVVSWKVYANDSTNVWSVSGTYNFTIQATVTFYFNAGGNFTLAGASVANGSSVVYTSPANLALAGAAASGSYFWSSFNWTAVTSGSSTSNPLLYPVANKTDLWCYFSADKHIQAAFNMTPSNPLAGAGVTMQSYSLSSSSITDYSWSFGDGNTTAGASYSSIVHSYAAAGNYSVSLTVTSAAGSSSLIELMPVGDLQTGWTAGNSSGWISGNATGWVQGNSSGYSQGYSQGWSDGNSSGYSSGYAVGWTIGNGTGWISGNSTGWIQGNSSGWTAGYSLGYSVGWSIGNSSGYAQGYSDGLGNGTGSNSTGGIPDDEMAAAMVVTATVTCLIVGPVCLVFAGKRKRDPFGFG